MSKELKVLIIEDSENDTILLLRQLKQGGYEPVYERIETPEAMKEALDSRTWDIIVSDHSMPQFSGLAALGLLKKSGLDIPFIIVSGNIGEDIAVAAMKAGAHDYIMKGNLTRLVPAVERELREAEVRLSQRRAENALHERTEELRKLNVHLQEVREAERTSIARDIHDELGQIITALRMDLVWIKNTYKDDEVLYDKSNAMLALVDSTIQSIQNIIASLRPGILDVLGIYAAIEWQAEEMKKISGMSCNLQLPAEEVPISEKISINLFRIVQELCTNITRYARATRVSLSLNRIDDNLVLAVTDNGVGIKPNDISNPTSFGIIGIRERVFSMGGDIKITGSPGSGTSYHITIPLRDAG